MLFSVGLVILGKLHVNEERIIMEKLFKAPIADVFSVLDIEYNKAEIILKNHNIIIAGSEKTTGSGLHSSRISIFVWVVDELID